MRYSEIHEVEQCNRDKNTKCGKPLREFHLAYEVESSVLRLYFQKIQDCNSVPQYVLKETNVGKLSVILHITFLHSVEIAIDKRNYFSR